MTRSARSCQGISKGVESTCVYGFHSLRLDPVTAMDPANNPDRVISPELLSPLLKRICSGWWPHVEAPEGWWEVLNRLDTDLAAIDPEYQLRRAARIDNELIYLTRTTGGGSRFARRVRRAKEEVRTVCGRCGRPGIPRTRSRTVLCDLHWHPLTPGEKAFALSADIPEAWFTEAAEAKNDASLARSAAAQRRESANYSSERHIAGLLSVTVERVHEMFEQELLAGANHDGRVVYPRWQVMEGGHLLPHLPAVLRAADGIEARTLQAIMENVDEDLDGATPAQWLAKGGQVEAVLQTLNQWWWI